MTSRICAVIAVAAAATACGPKGDPGLVKLNGRLEAPLVDLAPKVAGRVISIAVKEGERVKAGALLFELDPALFEQRVASLEAKLVETQYQIKQPEDKDG